MDPALFKSKVYLVTGGAAGIGLACVEHLLKAGAHVYAVDIHPEPTKEFATLQNERLTYFHADVRDRARSHEVLTLILSKHNQLDGLVNNAAVTLLEGELAGDDMYDEIMEINVRGVWNYGTEALAQMQKQGSGSIVNIASISALAGKARLALYSASKHAMLGFTRTWAIDFAKYGVRVNCVAPGKSSFYLTWEVTDGLRCNGYCDGEESAEDGDGSGLWDG